MHAQMLLMQPLIWIALIVVVVAALWFASWWRLDAAVRRASRLAPREHAETAGGAETGMKEETGTRSDVGGRPMRTRSASPYERRWTSGGRARARR